MCSQESYIRLELANNQLHFSSLQELQQNNEIEGSVEHIRKVFDRERLTGIDLENAIMHIEDLIMPILRALPKYHMLQIEGPELERAIGLIISGAEDKMIPLDSVENLYRQLAAYAGGSPVAWRYDIAPEDTALGLLILREVMHHGGFRYLCL